MVLEFEIFGSIECEPCALCERMDCGWRDDALFEEFRIAVEIRGNVLVLVNVFRFCDNTRKCRRTVCFRTGPERQPARMIVRIIQSFFAQDIRKAAHLVNIYKRFVSVYLQDDSGRVRACGVRKTCEYIFLASSYKITSGSPACILGGVV